MSGPTTHHLRVDIKGVLWEALDKSKLHGMFQSGDGHTLNAREAFNELIDKLRQGHRFIKCGDCDGFDPFEKGCPGHPKEPQQSDGIQRGNSDLEPSQLADGWAPR
ncbi:MAG TPA: hypothetical protein VGE09_03220 [Pseudoxanthomonas sp.]